MIYLISFCIGQLNETKSRIKSTKNETSSVHYKQLLLCVCVCVWVCVCVRAFVRACVSQRHLSQQLCPHPSRGSYIKNLANVRDTEYPLDPHIGDSLSNIVIHQHRVAQMAERGTQDRKVPVQTPPGSKETCFEYSKYVLNKN